MMLSLLSRPLLPCKALLPKYRDSSFLSREKDFETILSELVRVCGFRSLRPLDSIFESVSDGGDLKLAEIIIEELNPLQQSIFFMLAQRTCSFLLPTAFVKGIIKEEDRFLFLGRYEVEQQVAKWGRVNEEDERVWRAEVRLLLRLLSLVSQTKQIDRIE